LPIAAKVMAETYGRTGDALQIAIFLEAFGRL